MLASTVLRNGLIAVRDYRCRFGPHDTPYPELHQTFSLSYVRSGSFGYHTRGGVFELVAGSLLIGHPGDEFMCTHDHQRGGDECLSFQLAPEVVESLNLRGGTWRTPCVPPISELVVLGELAQAVARGDGDCGLDELGLLLASRCASVVSQRKPKPVRASPSDRRRAIDAAAWLAAHAREPVDLLRTAAAVALSPFHFLRVFRSVIGVTPHQYLIQCRLRLAARELAESDRNISDVAGACGFADLSNFVRTFRRAAGVTPRSYRRAALGGELPTPADAFAP